MHLNGAKGLPGVPFESDVQQHTGRTRREGLTMSSSGIRDLVSTAFSRSILLGVVGAIITGIIVAYAEKLSIGW